MQDIYFDITQRDIDLDSTGDFVLTQDPSVQNGGIIQFSRCAFITNPMLGIGMESVVNTNSLKTSVEMNRWQNQAVNDGATIAQWSSNIIGGSGYGTVNIKTQISYD